MWFKSDIKSVLYIFFYSLNTYIFSCADPTIVNYQEKIIVKILTVKLW